MLLPYGKCIRPTVVQHTFGLARQLFPVQFEVEEMRVVKVQLILEHGSHLVPRQDTETFQRFDHVRVLQGISSDRAQTVPSPESDPLVLSANQRLGAEMNAGCCVRVEAASEVEVLGEVVCYHGLFQHDAYDGNVRSADVVQGGQ